MHILLLLLLFAMIVQRKQRNRFHMYVRMYIWTHMILCYLHQFLANLPIETKKHMTRKQCNLEWSVNDVMAGLLEEIQILEMCHCTGKSSSFDNTMPTTGTLHANTEHTPHSCNDYQKRESVCVFCTVVILF